MRPNLDGEFDLLKLAKEFWPTVHLYSKQREIIQSVMYNDKTVVVAGNKLG